MPAGGNPPMVTMPSAVFSTLSGYTYNSSAKAFIDSSSNQIFLFLETDGSSGAQWFYATNSQGGINPKGIIPSATANIILHGTYNQTTGVMTYNAVDYKIRLERDSNGTPTAAAYVV